MLLREEREGLEGGQETRKLRDEMVLQHLDDPPRGQPGSTSLLASAGRGRFPSQLGLPPFPSQAPLMQLSPPPPPPLVARWEGTDRDRPDDPGRQAGGGGNAHRSSDDDEDEKSLSPTPSLFHRRGRASFFCRCFLRSFVRFRGQPSLTDESFI